MKKRIQSVFNLCAISILLVGCSQQPVEGSSVDTPPKPKPEKESKTMLLMTTSKGNIKLELNAEKAPKTVAHFLKYVEKGHYNGTIFHRVISDFMIQGGGFTRDMQEKPAPDTVDNEADNGLKNELGTIAMARTMDPHSASAQFFINTKENEFLNFRSPTRQGWGYCVFGKVVEGMDVVEAIDGVSTGRKGGARRCARGACNDYGCL